MALLPSGLAKTGVVPFQIYPKTIDQSARISKADSATIEMPYTSKGTATNLLKFTFSGWVKRGAVGDSTFHPIISAGTTTTNDTIVFTNVDRIEYNLRISPSIRSSHYTTAVFRDPSAWYHVVVAYDAANATAADRCKIYVNGVQQEIVVNNGIETDRDTRFTNNASTDDVYMGYGFRAGTAYYSEMYRAEFHMVDGQTLDPTYFAEERSGIWVPKTYEGTYGNNGFHIDFSDTTVSAGSITSVNDSSPNGLDFNTVTNVEVSDIVSDSPTNNFCTLNYADYEDQGGDITEGGLQIDDVSSSANSYSRGTIGVTSGKWYYEVYFINAVNGGHIGWAPSEFSFTSGNPFSAVGQTPSCIHTSHTTTSIRRTDDVAPYSNSLVPGTYSQGAGVVLGVAYDADAGEIKYFLDGAAMDSGNVIVSVGKPELGWMPFVGVIGGGSTQDYSINFGQDSTFQGQETAGGNSDANGIGDFAYAPPSGYLALCTSNLPDPVFDPAEEATADQHFNVYTYTGNGGTQLIGDVVREIPDTYPISQSLRFEDGDSAHLVRTPTSNGSRTTFTWSGWVRRGNLGANLTQNPYIFGFGSSSGSAGGLRFDLDDQLKFLAHPSYKIATTRTFADPSEWLHIVIAVDTTQASVDDAYKLWVNGIQITDFSEQDNITLVTPQINETSYPIAIGRIQYSGAASNYWDGYMAEIHFVDGTTYEASDFGVFDADGLWRPIEPSVTYGTNGFHLDFADSADIGDDNSGNTNDFTVNNLVASDVVVDTPTNQFATISSVERSSDLRSYEGNLATSGSLDAWRSGRATTAVRSGKWYWEVISEYSSTFDERGIYGVANDQISYGDYLSDAQPNNSVGAIQFNGTAVRFYGTNSLADQTDTTFVSASDVFNFAFDADNGDLYCGRNGVWYNSGNPAAGTGATNTNLDVSNGMAPAYSHYGPSGDTTGYWNFGQDSTFAGNKSPASNADENGYGEFQYAPPSGFLALCENNLIQFDDNPLESPDFVWIKNREATWDHVLVDSVRGSSATLASSNAGAEVDPGGRGYVESFNKNGFVVTGGASGDERTNDSGVDYVAWAWKAGGTASTIAVGDIDETNPTIAADVSANTDAGFSIVAYTGNGLATQTVPTGLNQPAEMIMTKRRTGTDRAWAVYHHKNTSAPATDYLQLNDVTVTTDSDAFWDDTPPDTGFYTIDTSVTVNDNGDKHIAYCFHSVDGFSKVGSYVGNGSTNGVFVYTGFRPKWIMVKRSDSGVATADWYIWDAERNTFNVAGKTVQANENTEESDSGNHDLDILSNGFKLRIDYATVNGSGNDFIYLAFAEQPFKYSNAR